MDLKPEYILWSGRKQRVSELIQSSTFVSNRDKEIVAFLREWYSDDTQIQAFTSGSTGKPKRIALSKDFVAQSALRTLNYFQLQPNDEVLHCLPMHFIAGKLMVVRSLIGKLDMFVEDPESGFECLANQRFKFAAMVPNQVQKLMNTHENTWNIEHLLIGGSALPKEQENQLLSKGNQCYSSYGMTETATHIAIRKITRENTENWYTCLEGISVGKSDTGCLKIFMPGLETPCIETTDLAEVKDEHTFKITGRKDLIINSGGIKLSPEEIESKLSLELKDPFFISSLPHKTLGQQVVLITKKSNSPNAEQTIHEICVRLLNKYERPKRIIFVDEIPRTSTGKILRTLNT